jgi:hypothetical protein
MFRIFVMTLLFCGAAHALEPQQLREKTSPSIVLVRALDKDEKPMRTGSGVVIGRGQVVTSCHVLAKAKGVQVKHQDIIYAATLQYADVERDLCQLSAPKLPAPAVTLSGVEAVRLNQRVYAAGFALAAEPVLSEGVVAVLREYHGMPIIQTSTTVAENAGGAALFDGDARLIGITTILVTDTPGNFAIAADAIREIPQRAQGAREREEGTARSARPYEAEWVPRIAMLENAQGELTLSRALAILLDIKDSGEINLLAEHEAEIKRMEWSSAYALGSDRKGNLVWGGGYRLSVPDWASDTALEYCARADGDLCKVVMVNGEFLEKNFIGVAKQLVRQNIATVRRSFLQSLTKRPSENRTAGAGGSRPNPNSGTAVGFASIRNE